MNSDLSAGDGKIEPVQNSDEIDVKESSCGTDRGCGSGCCGGGADKEKEQSGCCCQKQEESGCACSSENIPLVVEEVTTASTDAKFFVVSVHYSKMGITENFVADFSGIRLNDMVVVESQRGIDIGIVVHKPTPAEKSPRGLGKVLRLVTESDRNMLDHIENHNEPEELMYCKSKVSERKMPMKMAGIEHLFGGDKIIFYFLADGRVDFRELVKDLARRYRTRIEMRQIGVRDEARMLSDYEHCGRELCCRSFIRELEPVTMRMAKIQKSTLDPTKISGHCGRLMCCLRFEDDVYKENKKTLPYKNDIVGTESQSGRVISAETLSQKVTIELRDGSREVIDARDIVSRKKASVPSGIAPEQNNRKGGKPERQ